MNWTTLVSADWTSPEAPNPYLPVQWAQTSKIVCSFSRTLRRKVNF